MRIYTGLCGGEKLKRVKQYDLGVMISSSQKDPTKAIADMPCALDNGAFSSWKLGQPFNEYRFLRTLDRCIINGINLDFIVVPDIVAGGRLSLEFSVKWLDRLNSKNLALAVQDGMDDWRIRGYILDKISHIFVGGTPRWKWETAEEWVKFAHENGKQCHIGQCGKLEYLRKARDIGADSCDSTSFVVNDSWHILDEFLKPKQKELV